MSGGEIRIMTDEEVNNDPEMTAEAHQKWLDKEKEEKEYEAWKRTRAKKRVEKEVLVAILKGAGLAIEAQVEKQTDLLSCPISGCLFEDPVFCPGDGMTYEKTKIEEWFKKNDKSPFNLSLVLTEQQKICVPNFAIRSACDAIRKEKQPENRSSNIPSPSGDEYKNLNKVIDELKDQLDNEFLEGINLANDEWNYTLGWFWKNFFEYFEATYPGSGIYSRLRSFKEKYVPLRPRIGDPDEPKNIMELMDDEWEKVKAQLPNDHPAITGEEPADPQDKYQEGLEHQQENVCNELASFWKKFHDFSKEIGTTQTIYEYVGMFKESVKDDDEISWIMEQMEALPPTPPPPDISRISLEDMPGRR